MPNPSYIIVANRKGGGTSKDLQACLDALSHHKDVVTKSVVGKSEGPSRLLIEGNPEAIAKLRSEFGNRLIIEEDQPLKPFG